MPVPYPQEFRDDVVRVARNREKGVTLAQIAKDFGVHEMTLSKWLRQAAAEDGEEPGVTRSESAETASLPTPGPADGFGQLGGKCRPVEPGNGYRRSGRLRVHGYPVAFPRENGGGLKRLKAG
ncbi:MULTISPECIES: transposase [unclassified Streptomyces]|uniref:transposase n=1 Tax=unclassified Streptomyces TaxID=2593676 RepID=UPI00340B2098|nr:transposase [Streptomyces sp. NBC_01744]